MTHVPVIRNGSYTLTMATVLCAHRSSEGRLDCISPGHFRLEGPDVPDGEDSMFCFSHGRELLSEKGAA